MAVEPCDTATATQAFLGCATALEKLCNDPKQQHRLDLLNSFLPGLKEGSLIPPTAADWQAMVQEEQVGSMRLVCWPAQRQARLAFLKPAPSTALLIQACMIARVAHRHCVGCMHMHHPDTPPLPLLPAGAPAPGH
jgi:hypothetical protein